MEAHCSSGAFNPRNGRSSSLEAATSLIASTSSFSVSGFIHLRQIPTRENDLLSIIFQLARFGAGLNFLFFRLALTLSPCVVCAAGHTEHLHGPPVATGPTWNWSVSEHFLRVSLLVTAPVRRMKPTVAARPTTRETLTQLVHLFRERNAVSGARTTPV